MASSHKDALRRPQLRPLTATAEERHVSWLELFFDLVFVVAIAELAHTLSADLSRGGFARAAALAVPVWWVWVGYTFYADRFDSDDPPYRLLMLGGMLAVSGMAVTIHDATGAGAVPFALAYVASKGALAGLYARAWWHEPVARDLAARYLIALGTGATLWGASIVLAAPIRPWLWGAGLLVELVLPLASLEVARRTPFDSSHIPERFGLFTILVLGESVISIVRGVANTPWHAATTGVAAAGFAAIAALWWAYFGGGTGGPSVTASWAGLAFVYAHLPLVMGLIAMAVGIEHAILEAGGGVLRSGTRWALFGGGALVLACIGLLRRILHRPDRLVVPLTTATVAATLGIAGTPLPSLAAETLLFILLLAAGGAWPWPRPAHAVTLPGAGAGADPPGRPPSCTHVGQIVDPPPRTPGGCEECLRLGARWVELRLCLTCGHVGCCENSKHKHAAAHFHATGHPIIRSFEPDEDWCWCYVDRRYVYVPGGVTGSPAGLRA